MGPETKRTSSIIFLFSILMFVFAVVIVVFVAVTVVVVVVNLLLFVVFGVLVRKLGACRFNVLLV